MATLATDPVDRPSLERMRLAMPSHLIHVRPNRTGIWVVQQDDLDTPFSKHTNETEAERAAIERAAALDDTSVIIHDRYTRVRIVHPDALARARRSPKSGCASSTRPA